MTQYEIFSAACELRDFGARQQYLDEACGDNLELRRRVETLLRSSEAADSFLESPAPAMAAVIEVPDQTMASQTGARKFADNLEEGFLGDYQILREIGRGGMGVVYEAQQVSLRRRVALKVLPYAAILDKTQLARFKNEACAAASLDHPNVVHVHSVGTERGVHYYAMQLIDGRTVADVIAEEQKQRCMTQEPAHDSPRKSSEYEPIEACGVPNAKPSTQSETLQDTANAVSLSATTRKNGDERHRIRALVKLAIQAAEALEHAHCMGIVHRDIKPSNLLVDSEQHLWVADFGLAMIEAEGTLSTSGSILGTLRYMSPEQMRADRHVLDHHTDIYSLGATLYEMLTLQPVFPEANVTRLMQRIPNDEPIAPRKLNNAIPRDVETIVLKAMSKDPDDRYSTARELAAELRCFLDDQPIHAKPPGPLKRARKWARRHRTVVTSVAATLLFAIAIAGGLLCSEQSKTLAALARETQQRRLADDQKQIAQRQGKLAEEQKVLAVAAKKQSQENLASALDAVDKLLKHASSPELKEIPQAQPIRQKILEDVLTFYEQFKITTGDSATIQHRAAETWSNLAALARDLGQHDLANRALRKSLAGFEQLSEEFPKNRGYQYQTIETLLSLGSFMAHRQKDLPEARKQLERAMGRAERLLIDDPQRADLWSRRKITALLILARVAWISGDEDSHRKYVLKANDLFGEIDTDGFDEKIELDVNLALVFRNSDPDRADPLYRTAVANSRQRMQKQSTRFLESAHAGVLNQASRFFKERDRQLAAKLSSEAVEIGERLVADFPNMPLYRLLLDHAVQIRVDLLTANAPQNEQDVVISEFVARFPKHDWLHPRNAERLTRISNPLAGLTQAIEQFPKQSAYYEARGMSFVKQNRIDDALSDFRQAFETTDDRFHLSHRIASAARKLQHDQRYADMIALAELAREQGAEGWLADAVLCEAKLKLDRPIEALIHIDAAIAKTSEESTWLYKRRAEAHFGLQQYDKALVDLNTALQRNPNGLSAVTWISPELVAGCPDAEFREGIKQLVDRAVELNDRSDDSLQVRARLLKELSEASKAHEHQAQSPVDSNSRPAPPPLPELSPTSDN